MASGGLARRRVGWFGDEVQLTVVAGCGAHSGEVRRKNAGCWLMRTPSQRCRSRRFRHGKTGRNRTNRTDVPPPSPSRFKGLPSATRPHSSRPRRETAGSGCGGFLRRYFERWAHRTGKDQYSAAGRTITPSHSRRAPRSHPGVDSARTRGCLLRAACGSRAFRSQLG
jgi:hypothetical protein